MWFVFEAEYEIENRRADWNRPVRETMAWHGPFATEKEADEEIAAEGVGAEPMRATGGRRAEIEVLCFVAVRGKERAEEAGEGDDGEGRESEGGEFVFAEAEPSVVPEGVALFDGFVDRGGPRGDGRGAGEGRHGGLRIRGGLWGSSKPGRCRRRG